MRLFNTLTGRVEELEPREPGVVRMYTCGPTVYDHTHIGHLRPALIGDVLARHLQRKGWTVQWVTNFTDVDDRIIARANQEGVPPREYADRFIREYLEIMETLGIREVQRYVRVTDHIPQILEMVETLVRKGFAYDVDGDVYFSVQSKHDYGKLSKRTLEEMVAGARVMVDERKRHPMDFALWKAAKPGEPAWDSPWGPGRPGWHIECSAMSLCYLGDGFDIHGGGDDLIFPHHENEIAQSEAYTGHEPFVRLWLHNAMVQIDREKMSKSLGNFVPLAELCRQVPAGAIRFFVLTTHYRKPLAYSTQALAEARRGWERLVAARRHLTTRVGDGVGLSVGAQSPLREQAAAADRSFTAALDDDLNTAGALGVLFDLVRSANAAIAAGTATAADLVAVLEVLDACGGELGLWEGVDARQGVEASHTLVELLLAVRQRLRSYRDWETADWIRSRLAELGVVVEDGADGSRWYWREPVERGTHEG